jgi:hypothetical protein
LLFLDVDPSNASFDGFSGDCAQMCQAALSDDDMPGDGG